MEKKLLAIVYLFIIICLMTACHNGGPAYQIGFSQCSQGPWREKVNQEMLAAQHLYEHDVTVSIAQSYDDGELQARQIDSLTASGIDLLVVAPNEDSEALNAAIGRTLGEGVPVVFFDRKTSVEGYTAFIGGNNVEAGRVVGTAVAAIVKSGGGDRVLEITGAMSSSPARERHQGFAEVMGQCDGVGYESCDAGWTSDEASRIVKAKMADGWVPDIVFCHNDGMATGVYKAMVETGHKGDMLVYGIDGMAGEGLEYVRLGHQVGTYVYPTHGEKIIRLALDILTGKSYERENSLQGMMVTPENVEIVTLNANELMAQNDNLVTIQNKLQAYLGLYDTQRRALWVLGTGCVVLGVGCLVMGIGYVTRRRAIRQRQAVNEEQTLFYTDTTRRQLGDIFSKPDSDLKPPRTQDVIFAEQLNDTIRKHMGNPQLKMDDLGEEMGLSRVQLYRRVKAVTGLSPVELLRQMRLQRAYALLTSTTKTVQEIAFEVGFNTPGYFSKCFRQQYGKYPMEVRSATLVVSDK